MEFETTTSSSRTGLTADPQGPSRRVIIWDATIRLEVLEPLAGAAGALRIRTTYEKSLATVRSDTFDPLAAAAQEQYASLQGKSVEFGLDGDGSVVSISGLEGLVQDAQALETAGKWISQVTSGPGAPATGVVAGQKWSSTQPASLPIGGLSWRTESEYLRDEPCRAPVPAPDSAGAEPVVPFGNSPGGDECAVVLTRMDLVRGKSADDSTPDDYRKNGLRTSGKWNGSGQSLSYISLRTGMLVGMTQTGNEQMDFTLTSDTNQTLRYVGAISSRLQVSLTADPVEPHP